MNDKILIAYATRAGSTAEIAAEIGKSFSQKNLAVDVKPVKEKPTLDEYSAVILGSTIRMGSWLPEAVDFIEANQEKLNAMPVALFTVHMLNTGEDETSRANRLAYLDKVRTFLRDAEEIYFEGVMDFSKLSFLDRMIAKMVKAVEADNRDWDRIRNWIPEMLVAA
jgi:menaquinone-dependent protoporphyrinogen oxidase